MKLRKLFKCKLGFTLVELLVVIAMMAVLAAIAVPSIASMQTKDDEAFWASSCETVYDNANTVVKAYNEALAEHEISVLKQERDAIYDQYQDQIDAFDEQEEVLRRRQEDLEHERTKIEYEYGEAIDPLQDKVDALQQTYDDLDKYYQRLVDAVEVPMENLTEALREMTAAGSNYAAQYAKTVELLDTLYGLAPTWSPVEVGDLGQYKPTTSQYGRQPQNIDQSTTVYVDGVQLEGHDAQTMKDVLRKHTLM